MGGAIKSKTRNLIIVELTRRSARFREFLWMGEAEYKQLENFMGDPDCVVIALDLQMQDKDHTKLLRVRNLIVREDIVEILSYPVSLDESQLLRLKQKASSLEAMFALVEKE